MCRGGLGGRWVSVGGGGGGIGWGGGDRGVVHVYVCIFCSKLSTAPTETLLTWDNIGTLLTRYSSLFLPQQTTCHHLLPQPDSCLSTILSHSLVLMKFTLLLGDRCIHMCSASSTANYLPPSFPCPLQVKLRLHQGETGVCSCSLCLSQQPTCATQDLETPRPGARTAHRPPT